MSLLRKKKLMARVGSPFLIACYRSDKLMPFNFYYAAPYSNFTSISSGEMALTAPKKCIFPKYSVDYVGPLPRTAAAYS